MCATETQTVTKVWVDARNPGENGAPWISPSQGYVVHVTTADSTASNGVIHLISAALMPPAP